MCTSTAMCCMLFFSFLVLCAAPTSSLHFPNPLSDFRACGQTQPSHICDPSHMLSPAGVQAVEAILRQIEDKIKAPCGKNYQVAVAIVDKMRCVQTTTTTALILFCSVCIHYLLTLYWDGDHTSDYEFGNSYQEAQRFSRAVHDLWEVGFSDCQNGNTTFTCSLVHYL